MLGFGKKSVDDVLHVFVKAYEDLDQIAADKSDEAREHRDEAQRQTVLADHAAGEAGRARIVHDKIKALISAHKQEVE